MTLPAVPSLVNRRFRLQERLAVYGPMGVFRAEDTSSLPPRPVLLWMFPTHGTEARSLARTAEVRTDGVLTSLAMGEIVAGAGTGLSYLATESPEYSLSEGHDLVALATDLAGALSEVRHGGLHPGVVFYCGGRWKLGPVGLAGRGLASFGRQFVNFAAPELITGGTAQACDAWGLGALLLYAATGLPPFDGDLDEVVDAMVRMASPRSVSLPQPLDLIVAGCLLRDAERRWTPARVLATLQGRPSPGMAVVHKTASRPRSVHAWPQAGASRRSLHAASVTALAWQGDVLLSGDAEGRVVLSDANGQTVDRWDLGARIGAVAFSRGQRFAAAAGNGHLLMGSRQAGEHAVLVLECPLRALSWKSGLRGITTDGRWVDVSDDGRLDVHDAAPLLWCLSHDGELAATLDGIRLPLRPPPENGAAAVLAIEHTERGDILGLADGRLLCGTASHQGERAVLALAVHPRRLAVACARADRSVHLVVLPDLKATHVLSAAGQCLAFSPNGHHLAIGLADGAIGMWPVPT